MTTRDLLLRIALPLTGALLAFSTSPAMADDPQQPDASFALNQQSVEGTGLEGALESAVQTAADQPSWQPAEGLEQSWLQYEYAMQSSSPDGSVTGSHYGRSALIETVLARAGDGVTLRYDLPPEKDGKARGAFWYFPVDVRKLPDGSLELADPVAMLARVESWLIDQQVPRDLCGVWTHGGGFPFKFDCDPQSAIEQVEPFDLGTSGIGEGKSFVHPLGLEPGIFRAAEDDPGSLIATFAIDPVKARAEEVEQELVLAQMLGTDLSREEAVEQASKVSFEGTITLRFDFDASVAILRRTAETTVVVTRPGAEPETTISKNVVTRHSQEPDHSLPSTLRDFILTDDRLAPWSEDQQE